MNIAIYYIASENDNVEDVKEKEEKEVIEIKTIQKILTKII